MCDLFLVYSQIWLNLPREDCHFSYIFLWMIITLATNLKKFKKKNHDLHVLFVNFLTCCQFPNHTNLLNSVFNFFENFCLEPKWWSSIGTCRKSGYHPYEDLAKSGCKPNMEYKSLIIFL